jgi:hypothetical protein
MNPWLELPPKAPFVLPQDASAVERFNDRASERTRLEVLLLLPEPFVGRLEAPIILLALNPGVSEGDFALHDDPAFRSRVRSCHKQEPVEWPYYYLDPQVSGPGARWSARVLGPLIREVGATAVANGVVLFEHLAYHSRGFGHHRLELPSQRFTFDQVNDGLSRAAAIFVTRGFNYWSKAIPSLLNHPRLFRTRSAQNIVISPRNCSDGWDAALSALQRAG